MEDKKPKYDMKEIKRIFRSIETLNSTRSAIRDARALGLSAADVVAVVQAIKPGDFYKSMTANRDHYGMAGCVSCTVAVSVDVCEIHPGFRRRSTFSIIQKEMRCAMNAEMMSCPVCGCLLSREEREETCAYKGSSVTYMQPGWWCGTCDEAIFKGADNVIGNALFAELRARVDGILSPSQVRDIRKRMGLTQRQASALFGGGPNAFQKYESGTITPSVGISILIKLMESNQESVQVLSEIRAQLHEMPFAIPGIKRVSMSRQTA
ncbi:MAG: type II toxin-antitoxin system MqsR family toxin [Magnetococcales bacterium]|nr:type II toxin-antitoxin system MqsR family toxin [Magnetococcales bacterium]